MKELTDKEKLEVLENTVKVFEGKCTSCSGDIYEAHTFGCKERFVRCKKCEKTTQAETFGEAYLLFCISK